MKYLIKTIPKNNRVGIYLVKEWIVEGNHKTEQEIRDWFRIYKPEERIIEISICE